MHSPSWSSSRSRRPARISPLLPLLLMSCLEPAPDPGGGRPMCKVTSDCQREDLGICDPVSSTCRACLGPEDDPRCKERNPLTPRCGAGGICRACVGYGENKEGESQDCTDIDLRKPTCIAGVCQPCQKSADCLSLACLPDGQCVGMGDVIHVDNKNGTCNPDVTHAGTLMDPMCEVQHGVDAAREGRRPVVRVAASSVPYRRVTVSATAAGGLRIIGSGNTQPLIRDSGPALTVRAGVPAATVVVQGVDLSSLTDHAMVCYQDMGAPPHEVAILRGSVREADRVGVMATRCKLTMDGVRVYKNRQGGMRLDGTTYKLVNLMVYSNGGPGLVVKAAGPESTLSFSTVAYNVFVGPAAGIDCGGLPLPVESSIVVENFGGPQFGGCKLMNVVTGKDTAPPGGIARMPEFVMAQEPLDLRLKRDSPMNSECCVDKGGAGAPERDIDGRKRPQGAGPDIGAHEVQ